MSLFNPLRGRWGRTVLASKDRIGEYTRLTEFYRGRYFRQNSQRKTEERKLARNFAKPVVNAAAAFLAGKTVTFKIEGDEAGSVEANAVWERSGAETEFLSAAILGAICGDSCIQIQEGPEGAQLRFLDPGICHPEFDPNDYTRLTGLVVAYETVDAQGGRVRYYEEWRGGVWFTEVNDERTAAGTYDQATYGGIPAVWVRDQHIKGQRFGESDVANIEEMVIEYDHIRRRNADIIDYYSHPNLKFVGVKKQELQSQAHGLYTAYFVPEKGDVGFIEWSGSSPATEEHLDSTFDELVRISETPRVAFGDVESVSNLSGVALRIMFAPLMQKTTRKRANWGPALERAVWIALAMGGRKVDQRLLDIQWQDPVPTNEKEALECLEIEHRLGASTSQVLAKAGYTEEQIKTAKTERDQEEEQKGQMAMKLFDRGQ